MAGKLRKTETDFLIFGQWNIIGTALCNLLIKKMKGTSPNLYMKNAPHKKHLENIEWYGIMIFNNAQLRPEVREFIT